MNEATKNSAAPSVSAADQSADLEINKMFRKLIRHDGSDLHLKVGKPPILRLKGALRELDSPPITNEQMQQLCFPMLDERAKQQFDKVGGCDFAHIVELDGVSWRFRVNTAHQMGNVRMVARKIERFIPNFEGLNLPPVMDKLCEFERGLVLLAGVTGSGKSTTIASMLEWINHQRRSHILTIEDPIEFVYTDDKCVITQFEVGIDVQDFETAMKFAMRQDPDVMLLGELRDRESFATAMQAAETGHLVFGTVHASTAPSTIGRILDLFPQDMHAALRSSMAFNLNAIVAQKLLPTIVDTPKRVPIVEIMISNPTVRKLILHEADEKLPDAIRVGRDDGMQEFNQSLKDFIDRGIIDRQVAYEVSPNREALKMLLKGITVKDTGLV
jgi:twitching motility protein PilT